MRRSLLLLLLGICACRHKQDDYKSVGSVIDLSKVETAAKPFTLVLSELLFAPSDSLEYRVYQQTAVPTSFWFVIKKTGRHPQIVDSIKLEKTALALINPRRDFANSSSKKMSVRLFSNAALIKDYDFRRTILPKTDRREISCEEVPVQMGKREECTLKNISVYEAYNQTILDREVENATYYANSWPAMDATSPVGVNGLVSLTYRKSAKNLVVDALYEGGQTTLMLRQIGNDVKRTIIKSAD